MDPTSSESLAALLGRCRQGQAAANGLDVRQGPVQEDSEVQRLRLEIAQLRERVSALESDGAAGQQVDMARLRAEAQTEGYRGFVDLMNEKGGYP
jgi:hypothetical protein